MDKIYKKIEEYLREQFPKKKLERASHIPEKSSELYGTMSLPIRILEDKGVVYYQVLFNSKLKKK